MQEQIEIIVADEGQNFMVWRQVPTDPVGANIGPAAQAAQPEIEQLFIAAEGVEGDAFERKLYLIRRRFSELLKGQSDRLSQSHMVYACSLSSKVIVYKGMLTPGQLFPFYRDLEDTRFETHLAMVHSRFSTNTFPSWGRAQPNRYMSHNGEINTLRATEI